MTSKLFKIALMIGLWISSRLNELALVVPINAANISVILYMVQRMEDKFLRHYHILLQMFSTKRISWHQFYINLLRENCLWLCSQAHFVKFQRLNVVLKWWRLLEIVLNFFRKIYILQITINAANYLSSCCGVNCRHDNPWSIRD